MKISPIVPSSYSPVRRKTLFPATRASWVKPPRRAGSRRRTGCAGAAAAAGVRRGSCPLLLPFGAGASECFGHSLGGRLLDAKLDLAFLGRCGFRGDGGIALRGERLAQLGTVAVEGHRLDAMPPALLIGVEHVLDRRLVRHVDRLGDGAGEEALRGAHHPDVTHVVDEARSRLAALVGAIEDRQMLFAQERRTLDRHRAADDRIGLVDLALAESERSQKVKPGTAGIRGRDSRPLQRVFSERPDVERETELEDTRQCRLDLVDVVVHEAAIAQGVAVDVRRALERHRPQHVGEDGSPLVGGVPEVAQGGLDALVGDLEVAAAGQLLEFHQREIRLHPGGVAIHQQPDRAGRGEQCRLSVAVAVSFPVSQRAVPGITRGVQQ